jgi:hypothetical protein
VIAGEHFVSIRCVGLVLESGLIDRKLATLDGPVLVEGEGLELVEIVGRDEHRHAARAQSLE